MTQPPYGIHWFRRDLRVDGNAALQALSERCSGRVLGLFLVDPAIAARPDFSRNRFAFFLKNLVELRARMRECGSDLLVLRAGEPLTVFKTYLKPSVLSWNRDYEPYATRRDSEVEAWAMSQKIETITERDHLLFEPGEILKPDGKPYQIYTPFARRWFQAMRSAEGVARIDRGQSPKKRPQFQAGDLAVSVRKTVPSEALDELLLEFAPTVPLPAAGPSAARKALDEWKASMPEYATRRDFPADPGTSRLSPYLKCGAITVPEIIAHLGLGTCEIEVKEGRTVFLKELVWREFYYSILSLFPKVETEAFVAKYRGIRWENRTDFFEAWKAGRTGYPIVDAGMRQLLSTGWMHNRVRMIVASFLTKDLHIDWRWGERHFMQYLIDGDLAANNGGWQWAASTGCDPQPYFRIFNPELQSRKFDPNGDYLRRWVPELAHLGAREIHAPEKNRPGNYPEPIVNHAARKMGALRLYG